MASSSFPSQTAQPGLGAPSSPPGLPSVFGPNSFTASPLFMPSHDTSGVSRAALASGSGDAVPFTAEDRMLLRMLYHQQQAIHVQLNALTTWVQHFATLLSRIDRNTREQEPRWTQQGSDAVGVSADATSSLRGGVARSGTASVARSSEVERARPHPRPATGSAATPPTAEDGQDLQPPRGDEDAHRIPAAAGHGQPRRLETANQASTPPGEPAAPPKPLGGRTPVAQDAGSAMNRSLESVGAVWDPTNHLPSQHSTSTRSSRATGGASQLGRQDNPLLAARSLAAPGAAARRPTSTSQDSSSMHNSSDNINASGFSSRPHTEDASLARPQPALARPPSSSSRPATGTGAPPSTSMARALGERDIPVFRGVEGRDWQAKSAAVGRSVDPVATSALLNRGARVPPPSRPAHAYTATRPNLQRQQPPSSARDDGSPQSAAQHRTSAEGGTRSAQHSPTPAAAAPPESDAHRGSAHNSARATHGRAYRHEAALHRLDVELETDSLSDGYGSYDSRQYMKSVGLL